MRSPCRPLSASLNRWSRGPRPRETSDTLPSPILRRLSRLSKAAPRLAARRGGRRPRPARDADGDKIFFEWSGTGKFPITGGPFQLVGGTGKFAGISGIGMFKGVTVATDDSGNGMGYATWTDCQYTIAK
jgi:hypothetical protein